MKSRFLRFGLLGLIVLPGAMIHAAERCLPATEVYTLDQLAELAKWSCVEGDLAIAPMVDEPMVIDLPKLERVTGGISFGGRILRELRMENLRSVGDNLFISMASYPNPSLAEVRLSRLTDIGGEVISVVGAKSLREDRIILPDAAVRAKLKFK